MPSILRALTAVAFISLGAPAFAQSWTERPYNPPVGSRWSIDTRADAEEQRAGGDQRTRQLRTRSELTIDEKLADGFRVSYVSREINISGTTPGNEIAEQAFGAMKGIVIRARTDASGKPLVIENIDEVKASMRTVIERMAAAFASKPQIAAFMRQLLESFLMVDAKAAAGLYMEDVPVLAAGQNTGLTPGSSRREAEEVPSPLVGAPVKSVLISRLTSWDNATGKARITRTREMDQEALRTATLAIVEKLVAASGDKDSAKIMEMLKQVSFNVETETFIDVQDGMTRSIEDRTTTSASVMGQTFRKVEKKVVTVSRLK